MRSQPPAFAEDKFASTAERVLSGSQLDEIGASCSSHTGLRGPRQEHSIGRDLLHAGSSVGLVEGL